MAEVTLRQAVKIIGCPTETLRRRVNEGDLPITRREGKIRRILIDVDALRRFAADYGYLFDEELAKRLIAK